MGAVLSSFIILPRKVIAAIMAFGAGVLVAALTFSLIGEAFNLAKDMAPVIAGVALGGISYSIANRILNKKNEDLKNRKRSHGENAGGGAEASGLSLMVGSLMDNIPEN